MIPSQPQLAVLSDRDTEDVPSSVGHVEVVWMNTVPAELRAAFTPYARWMATYAPRWCEKVVVEYNAGGGTDSSISVHVVREYNRVNVVVQPIWLQQGEDKRDEDAAHELVHLYSAPVDAWVDQLRASEWKDRPDWRDLRADQYRRADESFTVSMARLLLTFMPRPRDQR